MKQPVLPANGDTGWCCTFRTGGDCQRSVRSAAFAPASQNEGSMSGLQWLVRVQCTPDAAVKVAQAMARREDTAWVSLTSGGTEITCMTRSPVDQDAHALLLQRLPRTPSVVGVTAHCVMHTFVGGAMGLAIKSNALTEEEAAALRPTWFVWPRRLSFSPARTCKKAA